jgi:hypothetical protein
MAQYYLAVNGQQLGPFEVNQLIPNGMTQNTMVWTEGMPSWAPAASVPELAQLFMAPPAAPVPPMGAPAPSYGAPAYGAYQQPAASGFGVDKQKIDFFIMSNKDNFPVDKLPVIQQALSRMDENTFNNISMLQFKSPMTALLLSIFCGSLGVDRFYLGDTGLGIGKLLTAGGCGIWAIIDWFKIQDATRQKNFAQLTPYI